MLSPHDQDGLNQARDVHGLSVNSIVGYHHLEEVTSVKI